MGVHIAARVAALAPANEILATQATLAEAERSTDESFQDVTLRGVSTPVRIRAIAWM